MNNFLDAVSVALIFVFIQNLVVTSGYGLNEALRASTRPKQYISFAFMISGFSVVSSLICRLLDLNKAIFSLSNAWHTIIFCIVLAVIYLAAAVGINFLLPNQKKLRNKMGVAALNTLVISVPIITRKWAYTLPQAIGAGIGAGLAFLLAVVLIHAGMKAISRNQKIPKAFRGAPSIFFYVAILSLAFTGFSGTASFI